MGYSEDCRKYYIRKYSQEYTGSLGNRTTDKAKAASERFAQKAAMQKTLLYGMNKYYPTNTVKEIWAAVRQAHIQRKVGKNFGKRITLNYDIVERVVAAHQSWNKSSGHAFEEYIPNVLNTALRPHHLSVILQKDLTIKLNQSPSEICNKSDEIAWLNEQIGRNVFDLYVIQELNGERYVFGCLQSKTSIRDRVTRDREPSQQAMSKKFWSAGVTLNGDFFKNKKFQSMVNGGPGYPQNGWHGMYVIESPYYEGRIFDFEKFVDHANQAALAWRRDHESLDCNWMPT